jgi:hypothetical protein
MAWSTNDFKAKVREFLRTYQFQCEIIFPTAVPGGTSDLVNILAQSTSLPGKKVTPENVDFAGQQYQIAGEVSYSDWKITFRIDDNMDVYKKFRAWSELIIGSELNLVAFPAQYKTNLNLYQLDANGNRITSITLNGAWAASISDIAYDTTSKNIATFDIDFSYDFSVFKVL